MTLQNIRCELSFVRAHRTHTPLRWCICAFNAVGHCGYSVRVFVLSIVDTGEAHLWPNMRFYLFSISDLFLFDTARCRKALTKSYFNLIYANIVWNDCGVGAVQFSAHNNLWSGYCSLVTYHAGCSVWNGHCLLYEYRRLTQSEPTEYNHGKSNGKWDRTHFIRLGWHSHFSIHFFAIALKPCAHTICRTACTAHRNWATVALLCYERILCCEFDLIFCH